MRTGTAAERARRGLWAEDAAPTRIAMSRSGRCPHSTCRVWGGEAQEAGKSETRSHRPHGIGDHAEAQRVLQLTSTVS